MKDQREVWESAYRSAADLHSRDASELAVETAALLDAPCRMLELGCGVGADAAYLAGRGHTVTALDFSQPAIETAQERYGALVDAGRLRFATADLSEPLRVDGSFDLVYARLSLHYFPDARTKALFAEIAGLLRPGCLLTFMCRSVEDPMFGKGVEVEPDVFDHHHLRHFFSEAYTRECLVPAFDVLELVTVHGSLYGEPSAYVKAIARRR